MKKLLMTAVAVLVSAATFAQGELLFATRNTAAGVNAPVTFVNDPTKGPGPTWNAQLQLKNADGSYSPIASSLTKFQAPGAGGAAILDRYVQPVTAQFGTAGGQATVRMVAWDSARATFDDAKTAGNGFGESGDLTVTLGGGNLPPGDLPSSFTGFQVTPIPEPSTIALGVLGAAALLLRRRK